MPKLHIHRNYATVPNDLLNQDDLSLKAKGLFAYLQSKPDNWSFSKKNMANQLQEGMSAIKSAMKELREKGYLDTVPIQKADGTFGGHDYILFDSPKGRKSTPRIIHRSDNRPCISKKEDSKQEYSKKELATQDVASSNGKLVNELLSAFKERLGSTIGYGNKTQRRAVQSLLERMTSEELLQLIDECKEMQTTPYAPMVTTPHQLLTKLAQINAYKARNRVQNSGVPRETKREIDICPVCNVDPCVCM